MALNKTVKKVIQWALLIFIVGGMVLVPILTLALI